MSLGFKRFSANSYMFDNNKGSQFHQVLQLLVTFTFIIESKSLELINSRLYEQAQVHVAVTTAYSSERLLVQVRSSLYVLRRVHKHLWPYVFQRDLLLLQRETYLLSRNIKKSFDKTLKLRTSQSWIIIPVRARDFSPLQKVNTSCGAHPSTHLVGPAFFSDGKTDGFEVNPSLPCSIEVKNVWSCTSTTPVCFHGLDVDNFTLSLQITSCLTLKG